MSEWSGWQIAMHGASLAAIETLAITLYANDRTNNNDPTRLSWMELHEDDRHVYRDMASIIANPDIDDPSVGYPIERWREG